MLPELVMGFGGYDLIALIMRITLGVFFVIRGGQKLLMVERREALRRTLVAGKVPFPDFNKWWVPGWQFFTGMLLVVGFGTSFAAAVLGLIMLVAIFTDKIEEVRVRRNPQCAADWLCCFTYICEVSWGLIFLMLIAAGPGQYSLDFLLSQWNG